MKLEGATAFVTGGTGFIGGRLIEVLTGQYGMTVRALVRNTNAGGGAYRIARCGAEIVEGDIADTAALTEAMKGCDFVFHCAFGTTGDPKLDRTVTVDGTAAMLRAGAANGVQHFVYMSTIVVFGETPPVVDETFVPAKPWKWFYPRQKQAAERLVLAEHARSGLPVTILRPGSVYGPWGPAFTYYPISSLKAGRVVLVEDGAGVSNAVYVDDVVQAMILAARRGRVAPDTFILRGPDRVTWRAFYAAYEAMLGTDSLVSMTLAEVKAEAARRRRTAIRRALPAALGVLKGDASFKALAGQLPLIKSGWKMYRKYGGRPPAILAAAAPTGGAAGERPLIALPDMMWGYYAQRSDFRIDHARDILGYRPMFDLQRGMATTEQWARWAGLIDQA